MKRRDFLRGGLLLGTIGLIPQDMLAGAKIPLEQTSITPLEIRIGVGLIPVFDPNANGAVQEQFNLLRTEIKAETGVVLPKIRIRDSRRLDDLKYVFLTNGQVIGSGKISHDHPAVSAAGKGRTIIAESDEVAIKEAFQTAWFKCRYDIDHAADVDIMMGDADSYPQYVTHAFRLLHQGRLLYEYTPPTPREIELGDVQLVCW